MKHGDAVKDIAFTVEDCRALFQVSSLITAYSVYSRIWQPEHLNKDTCHNPDAYSFGHKWCIIIYTDLESEDALF